MNQHKKNKNPDSFLVINNHHSSIVNQLTHYPIATLPHCHIN
ncbi:hypothetical protein [Flavobacterium sp.]